MLCSEKELGLGADDRGILALPADAPLGADLATYLGLDDAILEIEITPNRPDALSVVGVAREVAALTGAPLPLSAGGGEGGRARGVGARRPWRSRRSDLCPRFCARVITGLTVRPSPPWLAQRLRAVGLRPINNLVDVTNYVMWELGQPLHAFDYDKVAERRIVVRRARPGRAHHHARRPDRALRPDMAMVCDPTRALAVGGVMGGADSEVTDADDVGAARGRVLGSRRRSDARPARSGSPPTPRIASSGAATSRACATRSTGPRSSWRTSAAARSRAA